MDEPSPARVDRLVQMAVLAALHESLPRKRRLRLVARLLAIARDWEREQAVIDLAARRLQAGAGDEMQAAAGRLRTTARLLDPNFDPTTHV